MVKMVKITGAKKVFRNMDKAVKSLKERWPVGLTLAGLHLQRKSMEQVPVDHGVLRESAFTRKTGKGFGTDVQVGYTAAYAPYVHEDLDAAHGKEFNRKYREEIAAGTENSRGENQKAKFLEDPARENQDRIIQIIKSVMEKA